MEKNPLLFPIPQTDFYKNIYFLISLTGLSQNLTKLLVVPFRLSAPIYGIILLRKVFIHQRRKVIVQGIVSGTIIIAIVIG